MPVPSDGPASEGRGKVSPRSDPGNKKSGPGGSAAKASELRRLVHGTAVTEAEEAAAVSACLFEEGLCLVGMGRAGDAAKRLSRAVDVAAKAGGAHRPA